MAFGLKHRACSDFILPDIPTEDADWPNNYTRAMQMDGNDILYRKEELRRAVSDLRDRGVYTAAKFAAELLSG